MNPQRNRLRPDACMITASFGLYRFLLIICPPTFRRDYGDEMATLFRDCCRDAWTRDGLLALPSVWGRALVDLAITAASEHMKEGAHISRPVFIRAGGLAGLIAGAWYALLLVAILASTATTNFNIYSGTFVATWVSSNILAATVPAAWILYVPGLLGLHLYLAQHAGRLGWLVWVAAIVTCVGAVLLFFGPLLLQISTPTTWPVAFYFRYYLYGAHYGLTGHVVLGVGLLGTGWTALRTHAVERPGWISLVAGILALVDAIAVTTTTGLFRGLWWAVGSIFLGRRLWSRQRSAMPHQSVFSPTN